MNMVAMAPAVDQKSLSIYTGNFTFEDDKLRKDVKALHPDYEMSDPRIWPVITSECIERLLKRPYAAYMNLPPYLAYERRLVETWASWHQDVGVEVKETDGGTSTRSRYFIRFPFIYNSQYQAHSGGYIDMNDYVTWVIGATGKAPDATVIVSVTQSTAAVTSAESLRDVLDEIHQMMQDEASKSAAEIERLTSELASEKQRPDIAEKAMMESKDKVEKELAETKRRMEIEAARNKTAEEDLQQRLKALQARYDMTKILHGSTIVQRDASRRLAAEQTVRVEAAEKKVKDRDTELSQRDAELVAAKKEIAAIAATKQRVSSFGMP